ncbi:MAG: ATP-binding cassette domain-containing protein, partial [bacterium]|nr:ATP-binding cassette domain-containing protein [bacterium]
MTDSFISIHDLHKRFGDQPVLKGVDLTVHEGEAIAIIGQSGCGKSVLLKHVIKLLDPDRGEVWFDGREL